MSTPLSFAEARKQADDSHRVPSNALALLSNQGAWVFYDPAQVAAANPQFSSLTPAQQQAFIGSVPNGIFLVIPAQDDANPETAPAGTPAPVQTVSTTAAPINLATIVEVSERTFTRDYTKDTMAPINKETINFRNTSSGITVQVALKGIQGVIFTPANFTLLPQGQQVVEVSFDVTLINQLPEGTSTIVNVMSLSSNTVLMGPPPAPAPVPPAPAPIPPPPAPVQGQWLQEVFLGSPDQLSEAQIFGKAPITVSNVFAISFQGGMQAGLTTRWTKTDSFAQGNYAISITADDGMKVFIDGNIVLNAWRDQAPTTYSANTFLNAGQHTIQVLHYNDRGAGTAVFNMNLIPQQIAIPLPPSPISPPPPLVIPPVIADPPVILVAPPIPATQPPLPPDVLVVPSGGGGFSEPVFNGGTDINRIEDENGRLINQIDQIDFAE
jgi:PA14 domain-containing protein